MPDKRVMTKKEVFALAFQLTSSALGGKPLPAPFSDEKYMRLEDLEAALDAVTQMLTESFEDMPEKVSEDFEVREAVRHKLDEVFADHVLRVRTAMDRLVRR
jgi:hypothetical protein